MLKQVIIVNEALKLPRGKLAAQVAHASVAAFLEAAEAVQQAWLDQGMPKIVLKVEVETARIELHDLAQRQGLPAQLVEDAGHTVIPTGTVTCLGLGPAEAAEIDALTGDRTAPKLAPNLTHLRLPHHFLIWIPQPTAYCWFKNTTPASCTVSKI